MKSMLLADYFGAWRVRTLCLAFSILLTGISSANAQDSRSKMSVLLHAFDSLTYSPESAKALATLGDAVNSFIKDKNNAQLLNTPEGRELRKRQIKLSNYLTIKSVFEKCATKSERNLTARILDTAGKAFDINIDCDCDIDPNANLIKAFDPIKKLSSTLLKSGVQKGVFSQAIKNAAVTFLDLKIKYSGVAVAPETVLEVCKSGKGRDLCNQETKANLLATAKSYLANAAASKDKYSIDSATNEINKKIDSINESLSGIQVAANRGWFSKYIWDRSSPDFSEANKSDFTTKYVNKYLAEASNGAGLLMLTQHMRNKIGGLRQIEEDIKKVSDSKTGNVKFAFTPHQKIATSDIQVAVKEAQQAILSQSQDLLTMELGRTQDDTKMTPQESEKNRDRDLGRLVKVNPQAVGQYLINNPGASWVICEEINKVNAQDESDAKWSKAYIWGGAIVGGGLLLTGIGSAAGAWVLAGTATAATMATVGTVATAAGIAIGLTDAGYQTVRATQARAAQNEFEAAFIAGNGDGGNIQEARAALSEFNEAKMQAMFSLGFSALDMGGLVGALKAGQFGAKLSARAGSNVESNKILDGATKVLKQITSNPVALSLIAKTRPLIANEKIAVFLGYLGQVSEKTRIMILEKMNSWAPEKFKTVIQDALAAANGCGK